MANDDIMAVRKNTKKIVVVLLTEQLNASFKLVSKTISLLSL
jgi:hypothetical protein